MTASLPTAAGEDHTLQWLGQAGFLLATTTVRIAIDPYLSDLCERVHGLRRLVEPSRTARDLAADVVLVSHWHEDHLDLDSAGEFAASGARIIAPPSCIDRLTGCGVPRGSLIAIRVGETIDHQGATITATPAQHRVPGFLTEDAVGYVIALDGLRVYHCGDTEYHRSLLDAAGHGPIDVALLCCNGSGGNMNVWEAAALAAQLRPGLAVPMHFGMWSDNDYGEQATLDPAEFAKHYRALRPDARVHTPTLETPVPLT